MTENTHEEVSEQGDSPSIPEVEFEESISGMVADTAPRLFAVVQVYGEREDARVGAWGLEFPECAEVISIEGTFRMGVRSANDALRWFAAPGVTTRVVWASDLGGTRIEVER
ncbi:hypothetical protein ABZ816_32425 [Actinosynnema sp. NPDC047251]